MLTSGEFSTVTRLTIKALRIYHDAGILVPEKIEPSNGYRYYGEASIQRAAAIRVLKELDFTLKEIEEVFTQCREEEDLSAYFSRKLDETDGALMRYATVKRRLTRFILDEEKCAAGDQFNISAKIIPDLPICSIRFTGSYDDIGHYLEMLLSTAESYAMGDPFALYYDMEYKEQDVDIEVGVVVRQTPANENLACRTLAGGKAVGLTYRGSYENIGTAYAKLFTYCREKGYPIQLPKREIYLKGPGLILPRDPKNFITEVLIMV